MVDVFDYSELLKDANGHTCESVAICDFIVCVYGNTVQAINLLDDYAWYSLGCRDFEQVQELF